MNVPAELIKTQSDRQAISEGCYFDPAPPEKVRKFIETFGVITERCHGGNVGDPLKVIPYQWEDIIRPLWGWRRKDGSRRFNEVSVWIPKKQNKSGLIALLGIFHCLLDEPAALGIVLASKVTQAKIVFNFAANTIRYGPLSKFVGRNNRIWIRDNVNRIEFTDKQGITSTLHIMPTTPEGCSGPSASLVIFDELAELNGTHARTIWDLLAGAGAARGGLYITISTPHFDREHLGYEKYSYARKVLEGNIIDTTVLPVIYSVPEDAKCICGKGCGEGWRCPEWWWKANPAVGITVSESFYFDEFHKVKNNPRKEAAWKTLHCGMWVGHSQQWIASNVWDACNEDFNEEQFYGCDSFWGVDLARKLDLASYCIIIPQGDKYYVIPRFFMPRDNAIEKEKLDHSPYLHWESQGLITLTDGDVIDYKVIKASILKDAERFNIVDFRFDPYGAESLRQELEEEGLDPVEAKQSYTVMSPPTAHFERLVLDKKIRHNGNPILAWNLNNCTTKEDTQQRIMIDKKRCTNRIDGVSATIIALVGVMADEGDWDIPLGGLL